MLYKSNYLLINKSKSDLVKVSKRDVMEKKFMQATHLKPGNYLMIDEFICQVRAIEKSKPGKHGSVKARITAFGVFDDQKRTLLTPGDTEVSVPIINKRNGVVVAIMGNDVQLMDSQSYETFNALKPSDISIKQGDDVEFMQIDQNVKILRTKKEQ